MYQPDALPFARQSPRPRFLIERVGDLLVRLYLDEREGPRVPPVDLMAMTRARPASSSATTPIAPQRSHRPPPRKAA